MTTLSALARPMVSAGSPTWAGARWIGVVDDVSGAADVLGAADDVGVVALIEAGGYSQARLLMRDGGRVRGFVELPICEGGVDVAALRSAAAALPTADQAPPQTGYPPITVVLCTRDRTEQLAGALSSVLALEYPGAVEVIVVDNAPATDATRRLVESLATSPSAITLRLVTEPRPGLGHARNAGLRHSTGDVVAFTDDDVVVDRDWLLRLADGFARGTDVTCVTGLVPSGELRTPVQAWFEQRVSWASSCRARVFRLADPPPDIAMFPFQVGVYGTGANFAMRRRTAFALGGFDEALGVGSPTHGGEDIDMFVRVIAAGHALAYEPSALVWHRHRADTAALTEQAVGYGSGLGAWLTTVALRPRLALRALRLSVAAARRVRKLGTADDGVGVGVGVGVDAQLRDVLAEVGRAERAGVLRGPWRYLRARARGASSRPLRRVEQTPR